MKGSAHPPCPPLPRTSPQGAAHPRTLVPMLRRTDNLIFRRMNQIAREAGVEDVTAIHGWILRYLHENEGREVFQRDIERDFSVTRSTVTSILQLMEKKGYIRRCSVQRDARLKQLVLTDAGRAADQKLHRCFLTMNQQVENALSPTEHDQLMTLLAKLQQDLDASLKSGESDPRR